MVPAVAGYDVSRVVHAVDSVGSERLKAVVLILVRVGVGEILP